MRFMLSIDVENLNERERAHIEDLIIDAFCTAGLSIRDLKQTIVAPTVAQLLDESGVSLAPQARQVLASLITVALDAVERETLHRTAAYLRDAMNDVEKHSYQLQTSDVRRLADEIDAIASTEQKTNSNANL